MALYSDIKLGYGPICSVIGYLLIFLQCERSDWEKVTRKS